MVEAHSIDDADDKDLWQKGNALIRSNFAVNPEMLEDEEWAKLYGEAIWIERFRIKKIAALLGNK